MKSYTPPTFAVTDVNSYKRYLSQEGYVVIRDVLDNDTRQALLDKFWEAWTTVSPGFDKNNADTWTIRNSCMMYAKGMAVFSGLPHSDFMWDLRLQHNIKNVFANIHNTTELVCSFDGFSVFFDRKQKTPKTWWHVDQHPSNTMYCVQGAYNFFPVHEDSSGFVVVPRSHTHTVLKAKYKGDWVPLEEHELPRPGVKLIIPENCLVLWNSRTIHANTGMSRREKRFDRLTGYITYLPKALRSEATLQEKVDAYRNGDGTSHWATRCEIKKYPWGFGPQYTAKNFNRIVPGHDIPEDRLALF